LERACQKYFGDALSLVGNALEGQTSKACCLLGSFNSGKSHLIYGCVESAPTAECHGARNHRTGGPGHEAQFLGKRQEVHSGASI
jgi:hypothetical protein